jgi:DNA-binding Lrp family transcriptional regulator
LNEQIILEDIQETYQFETLDQLKVVAADELRERIVSILVNEALTATQIAERLGQPANKIHYHVRELERVGLVRLVERREKGSILEKYFRAVARNYMVPSDLIRTLPPDETTAALGEFLRTVTDGFLRAFRAATAQNELEALTASRDHIWVTTEELKDLGRRINALLAPYESPRDIDGEDEYTISQIWYRTSAAERAEPESQSESSESGAKTGKKLDRSFAAGAFTYDRTALEQAVEENTLLDLTVLGYCQFADDVTPELIDRAIGHFRHKGVLKAPPDVREALLRKEARSPKTP